MFPNGLSVPGQTGWWSERFFYPIKQLQVAQSGTSGWVDLIFCILRGDMSGPSQLAKKKEAQKEGWSRKIKGQKKG